MKRIAPALVLYLLSPLVAEFLLGDFPITMLPLVLALGPMYGGGALLIREITRRAGRGWPTIVTLALAYGVVEEGLTTQSLFNPDYADAHLLVHGYVPALGIAVPWTVFVLALHTVWSIGTPIALVEESTGPRRTTPWLRTPGLVVSAALFLLGSVFTFAASYADGHFMASPTQLAVSAGIAVALVVAAFALPRRAAEASTTGTSAPRPMAVLVAALVAGGLFMGADALPTVPGTVMLVVALAGIAVLAARWSTRVGWGARHRLGLAAGALLTYAWHGFLMRSLQGGSPAIDLASHIVFAAGALALLWAVDRRIRRHDAAAPRVEAAPADTVRLPA